MRNGNVQHNRHLHLYLKRSYPTYEEWKPYKHRYFLIRFKFLSYLWGMETVVLTSFFIFHFSQFLSYLWGMETDNVSLYTAATLWVLILPMRNGNKLVKELIASWICEFLSYLWGMETQSSNLLHSFLKAVLILPMRNGNASSLS